jgi:hypothetical protein
MTNYALIKTENMTDTQCNELVRQFGSFIEFNKVPIEEALKCELSYRISELNYKYPDADKRLMKEYIEEALKNLDNLEEIINMKKIDISLKEAIKMVNKENNIRPVSSTKFTCSYERRKWFKFLQGKKEEIYQYNKTLETKEENRILTEVLDVADTIIERVIDWEDNPFKNNASFQEFVNKCYDYVREKYSNEIYVWSIFNEDITSSEIYSTAMYYYENIYIK